MNDNFNIMNIYEGNIYNRFNNNNFNYPRYEINQTGLNDLNINKFEYQNFMMKNKTPVQNKYHQDSSNYYQNMNHYLKRKYTPNQNNRVIRYQGNNNQNNFNESTNIISKQLEYKFNNINAIDNKSLQQNNLLLKIFIYIYSYEKTLSEKNIFINRNDSYYLINPSWLDKFKTNNSYDEIKRKLDSLNNALDYDLLNDSFIESIINRISKGYQQKNQIFKIKEHIDSIILNLPNNKDISITYQGIIFPKKIMELINKLDGNFLNISTPKDFRFIKNNIYYINNQNIIYGVFTKSALFEPIYAFIYDSYSDYYYEKEKLTHTDINKYLKEKRCNIQDEYQNLMNGEKKIGNLIILNKQRRKTIRSAQSPKKPLNRKNVNNNIDNSKGNNMKNETEIKTQINNVNINKQNNNLNNNANVNPINNQIKNRPNTTNENPKYLIIDNTFDDLAKKDDGKEILKAFIYIYYYEKALEEKNIFLNNNKEKYYLINPKWLEKFEAFYPYKNIKEVLQTKEEQNNYNSIDFNIENIINDISKNIQIKKKPLSKNLLNINTGLWTYEYNGNKYTFIYEGIIFPSKIMNI